ncbi:antiviral helicase [Gonapodya prolifera JEL478]|uniref:Antiviral helicase n=1 Tax=Gonapodya prolifera (strain JEL478) TaxID=1344416 RepID=A0A139A3E8_GONPJ|nr:antiviral helicase [Gonapodya prolifera JEL478]|eukprot:KXS11346.1 antiviral helicase [Gonapodya prolifera JEL478]
MPAQGENAGKDASAPVGTATSSGGVDQSTTTLSVQHQVRHQVAVPPNYNYVPLQKHVPPDKPARTWEFSLDPFQKTAVACIERNESVLVSAHTSAGKTVVAEYAIALGLLQKQRVIYTSPIKALSNQKYRDFLEIFGGDVGLMTGDVTLNPGASILVMTTEILRSMLYRGSEVTRELAWVVFDEIHYMRDKERGVVWEETIILLPRGVRYVFLSATIPNALQFAQWICWLKEQPCHVVYTNYRPVPLQHYLFPAGGDGIFLCVDEKGQFREENFQRAISAVADIKDDGGGKGGKGKGQSDLNKLIKMIMVKNYHPCIVFSFSKRECENNALQLSKLDFNNEEEKAGIEKVFNNGIKNLNDDDKALPQIENLLPLLQRGIGIHHAGLLPLLKEIVELLFQEGLIKVLFATETFSIGLNMPARTVLFTSVRKWDGRDTRWLGSGEYIQMSGRAGRRGKDDRGIVILMLDEKMEPSIAKGMLRGEADPLNSAFHLKYNMILNLLRVEDVQPEEMLRRSFFQFQNAAKLPDLELELNSLISERDALTIPDETNVNAYSEVKKALTDCVEDRRAIVNHPTYALPYMQPGRLVRVKVDTDESEPVQDYGWGVLISFQKKTVAAKGGTASDAIAAAVEGPRYLLDVLLLCAPGSEQAGKPRPLETSAPDAKFDACVVPCVIETLDGISSVKVFVPKDIRGLEARNQLGKTIREVEKRFPSGLPMLDPIGDMGIKDEKFKKLLKKIDVLQTKLKAHALSSDPRLPELLGLYEDKRKLTLRIRQQRKLIEQTTSVLHMDELHARKRVLRRLGYSNDNDVIDVKGRVACELTTGDELVLTELILNGVFNDLTSEQTCAVLACFVFQEKAEEIAKLKDDLQEPIRALQDTARRIARVSVESKLPVDEETYMQSFRTELVDVVYAWAQGIKFSQVVRMTDAFEGSIIRAIRRLEELLRQMAVAAKSIGNEDLEKKFETSIEKIKRDIVFANSLYIDQ